MVKIKFGTISVPTSHFLLLLSTDSTGSRKSKQTAIAQKSISTGSRP